MKTGVFTLRTRINAPASRVFDWHKQPGAFEKLTPPWVRAEIVERSKPGIEVGTRVRIRFGMGPFHLDWVAVHTDYAEGQMFRDVQVEGPFARWEHTHRVIPDGPDNCWLEDEINYEYGRGWRRWLVCPFVVADLRRVFTYRHRITKEELEKGEPS